MRKGIVVLMVMGPMVFGQGARLEAPWLTVYDEAGRARWEVQLDNMERDNRGWIGYGARITLYHEGEPQARMRAGELRTDATGWEWSLDDGVEGTWGILHVRAEQAHWRDTLSMTSIEAEADQVSLTAAKAGWTPGGSVQLRHVVMAVQGWQVEFPAGAYDMDDEVLVAQEAVLHGHGLEVVAGELRVSARGGEVTLADVQLRPVD